MKRLKVMNTNNVKWASNGMGMKLLSPKTPTSQPYYYKWGEVQISVSDTHYDNNLMILRCAIPVVCLNNKVR